MEKNILQETILRVLGELTGLQPQQSVSMADLSSRVQTELNTPQEEQSLFYVTISKTLGKLRSQGLCLNPRRGFWGLSSDGLLFCRGITTVPEAVSSWAESDDVYLLSVARQAVPCFGWFRNISKFCPECYLAGDCQRHAQDVRQLILQDLLLETTTVAESGLELEGDAEGGTETDSLLDWIADTDRLLESGIPKSLHAKVRRLVTHGVIIQLPPMSSFCAECGELIPVGEAVVWDQRQGNIHIKCWSEE